MNTLLTLMEQRDQLRDVLRELVAALCDETEEANLPDVDYALLILARCDRGTAPLVVDVELRGGKVDRATWPAGVELRIVDHDKDNATGYGEAGIVL